MGFNLADYEDVQSRVRRFQQAFPVGRIVTDVIQFNPEKGFILVAAQVYREHEDTLPAGVDYAYGDASTFAPNMRKWYVEDTVSSAIGRALSLVLEGDKKPTKQDMARVRNDAILEKTNQNSAIATVGADKITVAPAESWETFTATMPDEFATATHDVIANLKETLGAEEIPQCKHGNREKKQGTGKNGKPYLGYVCPIWDKKKEQCPPIWYNYIEQTGTFRAPDQTE